MGQKQRQVEGGGPSEKKKIITSVEDTSTNGEVLTATPSFPEKNPGTRDRGLESAKPYEGVNRKLLSTKMKTGTLCTVTTPSREIDHARKRV